MFVHGCEKLVTALAYLFCLTLAGSCLSRFAYFLADLCKHLYALKGQERIFLAPGIVGQKARERDR